jgi:hypothetical protein
MAAPWFWLGAIVRPAYHGRSRWARAAGYKTNQKGERNMSRRFVVSVVALFFASMALGMVVHGMLLGEDYARLVPKGLFRSPEDSQQQFPWMILAHVLIAIGFTWIYRAGRDARPWLGQGVRFGLAVAVLSTIPVYLIYFAVQPMPGALALKQAVFDTVSMVILGVIAAAINRDPPRAVA